VKALVEIHHGKVLVESAGQNKGSTFTVILPIHPEN
jgi:signal transduction histidine kinase